MAEDGCPLGQIRFDRHSASAQADVSEAAVDLSLDRCVRGTGLARELLRMGFNRWNNAGAFSRNRG